MINLPGKNLVQMLRVVVTCLMAGVTLMLLSMALLPKATASNAETIATKPASPYLMKSEMIHPARMFANLNRQSVAFDGQGHPHVVYGTDALYHAWYDGSQWQVETLDTNTGWDDTHASIAIQGIDIHIAYEKSGALYYAHWDGVHWQTEGLETGLYAIYPSIAIEPQSPYTLHIAYGSSDGSLVPGQFRVRHVWRDSAGWHSEAVDNAANAQDIILKLAPTAPYTLQVAYVDETDYSYPLLKYARHDTQGWHPEVAVSNCCRYEDSHIAFALMPTAPFTPYLAYTHYPDDSVYLLQRSQTGWQSTNIFDSFGIVYNLQGMEFEPTVPYTLHMVYASNVITFGYAVETYIRHGWGNGQTWQFETLAQSQPSGDGVLALEPTSPYTPAVAYLGNSDLHFTQRSTPTWSDTLVDQRGPAGTFNSLAIAPTAPFTAHVAYVYHGDLYHAWRSGTSWISQTIDAVGPLESVGAYGRHVSLALAPTDPFTPSIAYYDAEHDRLMYGYLNGLNWITSTVAISGWYPSLVLEPTAPFTPHISYIDRGSSHLTHAWLSGSSWLTETVDGGAQAGGDATSMAIAAGVPYTQSIAYYDKDQATINYAQHLTSGWATQTVDYSPFTDQYAKVALAFDPIAPYTPHLGYVWAHHGNMWSHMTVLHAQLTNTGWQTETVEKSTNFTSMRDLSLAIEPQAPYRLYMEFVNANNQYLAYKQSGHWQIQQWTNVTFDIDQYSSLALAPMSPTVPYIAYVSPIAGDLILLSGTEPSHFAFLPLIFQSSP